MTKKDYEAVSKAIRKQYLYEGNSEDSRAVLDALMDNLADYFRADNPDFRCQQFWAACRGEDYKGSNGRTSHYSKGVSNAR